MELRLIWVYFNCGFITGIYIDAPYHSVQGGVHEHDI